MIKKLPLVSFLSACVALPVYADGMGSYAPDYWNNFFITMEGSFTRNAIDHYFFDVLGTTDTVFSVKQNQSYGGRVGGGMMGRVWEDFALSGEVGLGYYGRTTLYPQGTGVFATVPGTFNMMNNILGLDFLIGLVYTNPCFGLYIKGGALVEDVNSKTSATLDPAAAAFATTFQSARNRTGVLPAIKVGGGYSFNENWALTVGYLHAFGSNVSVRGTFDPVTLDSSFTSDLSSPTLDSVLVGFQFTL